MGKFGCLLVVLAIVALFAFVVIPVIPQLSNSQTVDDYLKVALCGGGETLLREQYSERYIDGTAYSMNVYCVDNENIRREVTGTWILISMAAFLIPFGVGLMMMIFGIKTPTAQPINVKGTVIDVDALRKQVSTQQPSQTITLQHEGKHTVIDVDMLRQQATARQSGGGKKSLAERLRELEEARNAGLITYNEYDRLRDEILNNK